MVKKYLKPTKSNDKNLRENNPVDDFISSRAMNAKPDGMLKVLGKVPHRKPDPADELN